MMSELSERIKRLRRAQNLTQQELADRLDIDQGAVSRWERGHITPSPRYRQELERVLAAPLFEVDAPLLESVNRDLHFSLLLDCELDVLAASSVCLAVHGCREPSELVGQNYRHLLEASSFNLYRWLKDAGAFEEGIDWATTCLASPTLHSGSRWMESLWIPFRLANGKLVYRISNKLLSQPPHQGLGFARLEVGGNKLERLISSCKSNSEQKPRVTYQDQYSTL